jgi:glycosyltransferase involved in cell wall biosynthesis
MAFFSVVIPLYNKAHFIAQTLQSVLAQTFIDFEIIIVNDGSTDNSESIVQQFDDPRIQYYLRENKGVSAARNFGITMAKADYICFIDADDYWYPDFLQSIHRNITRFPGQHVFSCAIEIETAKNIVPAEYSIERDFPVMVVDFFKASLSEAVIWTSAAVFHKSVFERSGVFDAQLRSGEDTDLWIRIGLDYPIVFDWKVSARYVFDPKSLSRDNSHLLSKIKFSKFDALEKTNPDLKKYLDLNRFSLAIKSKLNGNRTAFGDFATPIDRKNLSVKRKMLLRLPGSALRILLRLNQWLAENGLGNSVFR